MNEKRGRALQIRRATIRRTNAARSARDCPGFVLPRRATALAPALSTAALATTKSAPAFTTAFSTTVASAIAATIATALATTILYY